MADLEDIAYCIDACALIDLKRLYPSDIFPTLWQRLGDLAENGRLFAPHEVLREVEKRDDELVQWLRNHKKMFKDLDEKQLKTVKEILDRFPGLVDPEKETPDADPFVIALAIEEQMARKLTLFGGKCIVVTQEKPARGDKPKIPDVCVQYEIESIPLDQLFRRENWTF